MEEDEEASDDPAGDIRSRYLKQIFRSNNFRGVNMGNEALEAALDALVSQLRETEEYRNYRARFEDIRHDESAMECVMHIRELNMSVQQMSEDDYERESENLASRMEELCSDSRVGDFILAEVDFSKLFQYITERLVGTLDD